MNQIAGVAGLQGILVKEQAKIGDGKPAFLFYRLSLPVGSEFPANRKREAPGNRILNFCQNGVRGF